MSLILEDSFLSISKSNIPSSNNSPYTIKNILLIDDDPSVLHALKIML